MLEPGQDAPDFTLPDQDGEELTLSDLRGETVVLYFYPRAETPGCTTQACGIRDRKADYAAAGARVIGVSPDEPAALQQVRRQPEPRVHPARRPRPRGRRRLRRLGREVDVRQEVHGHRCARPSSSTPTARSPRVFPKVQPKKHDALVLKALGARAADADAGPEARRPSARADAAALRRSARRPAMKRRRAEPGDHGGQREAVASVQGRVGEDAAGEAEADREGGVAAQLPLGEDEADARPGSSTGRPSRR